MKILVHSVLFLTLCAASATAASAQARLRSDTALQSMVAAQRAFSKHSLEVGSQSAFQRFMAMDGLLYRPRIVRASTYLRTRPMPRELLLGWEPVFADISAAGDLGYTTGPWMSAHRVRQDVQPSFGEYVTIWKRQQDGSWKAVLDAGIAHDADPVGPRGLATAPPPAWRRAATESAVALTTLLRADSALSQAAERMGSEPAFRQRAAQPLRLLRTGRFPLVGDSAMSWLRATPGYVWRVMDGGVASSGDLGYTYGVYSYTTGTGSARRATESGDYLRIWRRSASGEWRVALDLTSPRQ